MKEIKMKMTTPGPGRQHTPLKDKTNTLHIENEAKRIREKEAFPQQITNPSFIQSIEGTDIHSSHRNENELQDNKIISCNTEEIEYAYPYEEYLLENIEDIHKESDLLLEDIINPYFRI
ncbi:hypothetical protein NEPAR06_0131 [Nematocida parisii]|nr:hypothetical protein NEPAR06_0131 [Nematocida parisii]KAI5157920.1 hypothetical protein NEPAR05_1704 [Nematocida parisii]